MNENADALLSGFEKNQILIDALIEVALEREGQILSLITRATNSPRLGFRQKQIVPELLHHAISSVRLVANGWRAREAVWAGVGARSLYEAYNIADFVLSSEEQAQRFFEDGIIDLRDIFDSLDAQALSLGDVQQFNQLISALKNDLKGMLQQHGIRDRAKHLQIVDIAKAVGRLEEHRMVYQFLSKFSHSTSVAILARRGETWLNLVLPLVVWIGQRSYLLLMASVVDSIHE